MQKVDYPDFGMSVNGICNDASNAILRILAFDQRFGIIRSDSEQATQYYDGRGFDSNILNACTLETRQEAKDIIDALKGNKFIEIEGAMDNKTNYFRTEYGRDTKSKPDPGAHYRYTYKGIKLDPFRIAKIYGMTDFALQTILKKVLKCGERGQKNKRQDLLDIISAAQRAIELIDEDSDEVKT